MLAGGGVLFAAVLAADIPYADTEPPTTSQAPKSPAPPPSAEAVLPEATSTVTTTGIRTGPDDRTLLLQVRIPAGSPQCAREPRIEGLTEENGIIHANVVIDAVAADCRETVPSEFKLTTASPIANRTLMLGSGAPWNKLPDGTWGHCGRLGCDPPADHCADVWIEQTRGEAIDFDTRACDQGWLVVDRLNFPQSPSLRVLYRWTPEGWLGVTGVKSEGCEEILAKEPQFTRALCEKLGPIS
ncbi:hypothetical protein SAMN04489729_3412 [Amycolatopsis lurida]|uniref:Uncharacterized protein n=1 Tax=Amycolatopsis lurida NRRL 2430 TaxID=1460371 RepID=A0A2P2FRU8_AMYLU|nr:hypothetical protein BB31_21050 [Amycolatopsis lurida NRRL 2430]SED11728.1 hypothetical protein SAMN04489729_3412 [Amycolatopsis lurida]